MAIFLTLTDADYAVNLETATNILMVDEDIKIYFSSVCDCDLFGDDSGNLLPGIDADAGLSTPADMAVFLSPKAEKYQSVLAWWKSNTL